MKTPPLPARWTFRAPYLKDDEGTERHVMMGNGKLDRLHVAQILENHGHADHAKAWRDSRSTHKALAALVQCVEGMEADTLDDAFTAALDAARAALNA